MQSQSQVNAIGEKNHVEDYLDSSYQHGPYADSRRELTDKFCLLALIIGVILFILIFIYSLLNGDVE